MGDRKTVMTLKMILILDILHCSKYAATGHAGNINFMYFFWKPSLERHKRDLILSGPTLLYASTQIENVSNIYKSLSGKLQHYHYIINR